MATTAGTGSGHVRVRSPAPRALRDRALSARALWARALGPQLPVTASASISTSSPAGRPTYTVVRAGNPPSGRALANHAS